MTLPLTPRMGGSPFASETNALEAFTGWTEFDLTATYYSADAPSYKLQAPVALYDYVSPGYRVRLKQGGDYKYFIVTKLDTTGDYVHVTMYGGTDYSLADASITDLAFSPQKAPYRFPLDPAKWTEEVRDPNNRTQASPVSGTWYNLHSSHKIDLPVGVWHVSYFAFAEVIYSTAVEYDLRVALSTSTSSVTDGDLFILKEMFISGSGYHFGSDYQRAKTITVTSPATYYLIAMQGISDATELGFYGAVISTVISAVCAYL